MAKPTITKLGEIIKREGAFSEACIDSPIVVYKKNIQLYNVHISNDHIRKAHTRSTYLASAIIYVIDRYVESKLIKD